MIGIGISSSKVPMLETGRLSPADINKVPGCCFNLWSHLFEYSSGNLVTAVDLSTEANHGGPGTTVPTAVPGLNGLTAVDLTGAANEYFDRATLTGGARGEDATTIIVYRITDIGAEDVTVCSAVNASMSVFNYYTPVSTRILRAFNSGTIDTDREVDEEWHVDVNIARKNPTPDLIYGDGVLLAQQNTVNTPSHNGYRVGANQSGSKNCPMQFHAMFGFRSAISLTHLAFVHEVVRDVLGIGP